MKIFVAMPKGEIRNSFIPQDIKEKLEALGEVRWNESNKHLTEDELAEQIGDAEVCITGWSNAPFTKKVLDCAENLKVIAHTGGTVAFFTNDEVYDRGIKVMSGNEVFAQSVAEGVLCYMLAALRRIPQFCDQVQKEGWSKPGWYNEGLIGQKVGIIGFGAVSRYTVELLKPFQVELLICARHLNEEQTEALGAKKATLEEIFSTCKIVSVHLANTPENYHKIDESLMNRLKSDSLLVNTARGAVIDEAAMARLLRDNRFRAILDVFEEEPLPMSSPLRGLENVLLIPHMGGPTIDRRPFVTDALIKHLPAALRGEDTILDISKEAMHRMTK